MLRPFSLVMLLGACALRQPGLETMKERVLQQAADPRCGPVGIRRAALGSRWGEYLRVNVNAPSAITGEARLHIGSRPVPLKSFTVTGNELVVEASWPNERLSVPYGLEKGAVLDLTFVNLHAPNGDCAKISFDVEQGAYKPNVDERKWIAQLVARGGPDVEAWKEQQRRPPPPPPMPKLQKAVSTRGIPGDEKEWAAWHGEESAPDPSRGWAQWPVTSSAALVALGSSLAKGSWVALMSQPPSARVEVDRLAAQYGLKPVSTPQELASLVDKVRVDVETDDAAALMLFAGASATKLAIARAGVFAPLDGLSRALPASHRDAAAPAEFALQFTTAFGLDWPVPMSTRVSSPFGNRVHPTLGSVKLHTGIDLSMPVGTPVQATGKGTVVRAAEDSVNGLYVVVDHGHGVTTAYLHNSKLLVVEGQQVVLGDTVSLSGNTGRSTGPHLHYQLELNRTPMDPLIFRSPGASQHTNELVSALH